MLPFFFLQPLVIERYIKVLDQKYVLVNSKHNQNPHVLIKINHRTRMSYESKYSHCTRRVKYS